MNPGEQRTHKTALTDLAVELKLTTEAWDLEFTALRDRVEALDAALRGRWPGRARALGAMALSARFNVSASPLAPGSPKRVGRLAWHRLTGY